MKFSDTPNLEMQQKLKEEPTDRYLSRVTNAVTGPMAVTAGPGMPAHDGRPGQRVVGDDPVLLEKTAHVRKPKEKLMEFIARTGMSPNQMHTLSKEEILRFVETVSAHESVAPPPGSFGRPVPQRFTLDA